MNYKKTNEIKERLKDLFLPYFVKKNNVSVEQDRQVQDDCVNNEVVRLNFVAVVMIFIMIFYLIIGGYHNFLFSGKNMD